MNTYEVVYLENDEKKSVLIYAENKEKAGKVFTSKYPEIKDADAILSVENIDNESNDYGVARFAAGFIVFFGWITVLVGVGLIIVGLSELSKYGHISIGTMVTLLPAIWAFLAGFAMLVFGQTSLAVLDNTNYSKQMLAETRRARSRK